MADNLLGLGSEPIFPLSLNWVTNPRTGMILSRNILQKRGTVQLLGSFTDLVPQNFQASYLLFNKEDEYNFLEFIHNQRGKNKRFWIFHPKQSFILKEIASLGSSVLICYPNRAYSSYQGFERIWIGMENGDLISREIFSVTHDDLVGEMTLSFTDPLDREITLTNYYGIGRVLLVRFEEDEFSCKIQTDTVSQIDLNFYELVKEYSEI